MSAFDTTKVPSDEDSVHESSVDAAVVEKQQYDENEEEDVKTQHEDFKNEEKDVENEEKDVENEEDVEKHQEDSENEESEEEIEEVLRFYKTPSGKKLHKKKKCPRIKNSKQINVFEIPKGLLIPDKHLCSFCSHQDFDDFLQQFEKVSITEG